MFNSLRNYSLSKFLRGVYNCIPIKFFHRDVVLTISRIPLQNIYYDNNLSFHANNLLLALATAGTTKVVSLPLIQLTLCGKLGQRRGKINTTTEKHAPIMAIRPNHCTVSSDIVRYTP